MKFENTEKMDALEHPRHIVLYCNWGVYLQPEEGTLSLPGVHYSYLKALKTLGYEKITLISKTSSERRSSFDTTINANDVDIVSLPWFDGYVGALKNILSIFYVLARVKVNPTTKIFIRVWEPFAWFFALRLALFSPLLDRRSVVMHFLSEPLSAIFGHPHDSRAKKWLRLIFFMPEYYLTLMATWTCQPTCNGPLPKQVIPDIFSRRFLEVVDSAMTMSDVEWAVKRANQSPERRSPNQLLYVGFLRANKGVADLLEAIRMLVESGETDFCLQIVGSGEYLSSAEKFIDKHLLTDVIKLVGYVPFSEELFQLYLESDIFINPSWSEAGPRVVLEAKLCCNYIVSTDVGYIHRIVKDKSEGLIVPVGEPEQLGKAIADALASVREGNWTPLHDLEDLGHDVATEDLFKRAFNEA